MVLNVGLQGLFQNVNAIPPIIVLPACEPHGVGPAEQQNFADMAINWEDAKLDDHVINDVQQT